MRSFLLVLLCGFIGVQYACAEPATVGNAALTAEASSGKEQSKPESVTDQDKPAGQVGEGLSGAGTRELKDGEAKQKTKTPDSIATPASDGQVNSQTHATVTSSPTPVTKAPGAKADDAEVKLRQSEFDKGAKLFQCQQYAQALTHFSKAAKSAAEDGEGIIMEGYCFFNLRQYPKALTKYKEASEKGRLISIRNKAQKLAQTLDCCMRGICPGNCLKPSMPGWRKMYVAGKPEHLVWMVYPYLDPAGKGGCEYWSNDHMGEVIEYVNGRPVNRGKCPICHGTGHVSLPK
jgi:hypothetical protein